jgi:hypothetical protein
VAGLNAQCVHQFSNQPVKEMMSPVKALIFALNIVKGGAKRRPFCLLIIS